MNSRLFCSILFALPLFTARFVDAQQPGNIPRIGFMTVASQKTLAPRVEALKQGLSDLGYVVGKNLLIEWRFADGKLERQSDFAKEFVAMKVDAIVSSGPTNTQAAREATRTIPIIMAQDPDPIGNGFVVSLAKPGGNITGLSTVAAELGGKRLEVLKETVPKLTRAAVLVYREEPGNAQILREVDQAGKSLGVQIDKQEVKGVEGIETAFQAIGKSRADGILILHASIFIARRKQVVDLGNQSHRPVMYSQAEFVDDGGLMTYGVNPNELFRRAATYVDKILKGTKPTNLPVEQPKKFEFLVNLKAAKQIGLTIPPNVLARADRVIR